MSSPNFGAIRDEEPSVSTAVRMPREAVVSEYTALACLAILRSHCAVPTDAHPIDDIVRSDGDSLPLSRLIELAGDLGFAARYLYGDWRWLQMELSFHPTLLILKNTNVVVAVANGRIGIEEIVVKDPLHRDAETIILSREDLEQAWDGDLLVITPFLERSEKPDAACDKGNSVIIAQPEHPDISDAECDREDHSRQWWSAQSEPREKRLKSIRRHFFRMGLGFPAIVLSCLALISLLGVLLFVPFSHTSDKWAMERDRQQPSPTGVPVAHLELNSAHPTALAYAAVEKTTEKPSSSGVTLPPETSAKALSDVRTKLPGAGTTTAPADRRPTAPPQPQETLLEKPSVTEAGRSSPETTVAPIVDQSSTETPTKALPAVGADPTNPGSTLAAVKQGASDAMPPPEAQANALPAAAVGPTKPGSAPVRPSEADLTWLSSKQTLSETESAALLARGDDYLRVRDVTTARLFYERVADAGWANAALRLGETFDPIFLDHAQMLGIAGDMQKATFWYRRARDLGSTEARTLLLQLDAN